MGIAWFDDDRVIMGDPELRTGGFPLMAANVAWPECPHCAVPMLFRAQIPLHVTSLVHAEDESLLAIYECHAEVDGHRCLEGRVEWVDAANATLLKPPAPRSCDVWVNDLGPNPERVTSLIRILTEESTLLSIVPPPSPPLCVLRAAPRSIAEQTEKAFREIGAKASCISGDRTLLPFAKGANLMPFEDGFVGVRKTTLPPLSTLMSQGKRAVMRALLGGSTPGYRDHAVPCEGCNRPTRTAARLLGQRPIPETDLYLDPAFIQICLSCRQAQNFRGHTTVTSTNANAAALHT